MRGVYYFISAILFSAVIMGALLVVAQPEQVDAQGARAAQVAADMQQMSSLGASGFLYWMYAGADGDGFGHDQFAFYDGDPLCDTLRDNAGLFDWVGVNIPNLINSGHVDEAFSYLQGCGVSMVRIFASPDRNGLTPGGRAVVDLAASYGIRVILVICDFANSCDAFGLSGANQASPGGWYASGYTQYHTGVHYSGSYLDYARDMAALYNGSPGLYGFELLNEPHCMGLGGCVDDYVEWADIVASEIKAIAPAANVGIGQMSGQPCTLGDSALSEESPSDFELSNDSPSITMASGHYYTLDERTNMALAAAQAQALGKIFYIGEMGMEADGSMPAGGYLDTSCEWPVEIKGTVRSSRKYIDSNGTEVYNKPLEGIAVAAYQGSWDFKTGKRNGGEVVNLEANTFTDENGNFELITYKSEDSFDNSNYLYLCNNGVAVESFKLDLSQNILINQPINLDIDYVEGGLPQIPCPSSAKYVDRVNFLSCIENLLAKDGFVSTPSVVFGIELKREDVDTSFIGASNEPDCIPVGDGTNCPPPAPSVTAHDPLEGRLGSYESMDARAIFNAIYTLTGHGFNYRDGLTPPRSDVDEFELPLCEMTAACSYPIADEDHAGRNNQTCGGPATGAAQPYEWEERYSLFSNPGDIAACESSSGSIVYLDQIQPPWEPECAERLAYEVTDPDIPPLTGYAYDCRYFPVQILYNIGDGLQDTWQTKKFNEATNDAFVNQASQYRQIPFEDDTEGDLPFFGLNYVVHPAGPQNLYSQAAASVMFSNQTFDHDQFGGPPSMIFHSPFQPQCIDKTQGNLRNPDVELPKTGRGYYRQGLQQSLCTYNFSVAGEDHRATANNNEHDIRADSHRGVEGYKYLTEFTDPTDEGTFFGDTIVGAIASFISNVLQAIFGVFGTPTPGTTCAPLTFGSSYDGDCGDYTGPYECENTSCVYYPINQPLCNDGSDPPCNCNVSNCGGTVNSGEIAICKYKLKEDLGTYGEDGSGECVGDLEVDLNSYVFVENHKGVDIGLCALEVALPFASPQILEPLSSMGTLYTFDEIASNEKEPQQGQGRGAEYGTAGPGETVTWFGQLRNAVQDPLWCEEENPEDCILEVEPLP